MKRYVEFTVQQTGEKITFGVERMVNSGFSSSNPERVRKHLEELARFGIPLPTSVPTLYSVPTPMLVTSTTIEVQHEDTSGEVEYALLWHEGETYVTVASNHTDRRLERFNRELACQSSFNILCPQLWKLSDVIDHFDKLVLRSFLIINGEPDLYQGDSCANLRVPEQWSDIFAANGINKEGTIFLSGTIPTLHTNFCFATAYHVELVDPVLRRRLGHAYHVEVVPEVVA